MNQLQFHYFRKPSLSSYFQIFQLLQLFSLTVYSCCSLHYFLQPLTRWYTAALLPLLCVFRGLWGPVLRDRRVRQLEWWGPWAAVMLTHTHLWATVKENTNTTWKHPLLCTLLSRHRPAKKKKKNCYIQFLRTWTFVLLYNRWVPVKLYAGGIFCCIYNWVFII